MAKAPAPKVKMPSATKLPTFKTSTPKMPGLKGYIQASKIIPTKFPKI